MPAGISRIGLDQVLPDRERGLIAVDRGCEIALSPQHTANIVVGGGEVVLPVGISRVGPDVLRPGFETPGWAYSGGQL